MSSNSALHRPMVLSVFGAAWVILTQPTQNEPFIVSMTNGDTPLICGCCCVLSGEPSIIQMSPSSFQRPNTNITKRFGVLLARSDFLLTVGVSGQPAGFHTRTQSVLPLVL